MYIKQWFYNQKINTIIILALILTLLLSILVNSYFLFNLQKETLRKALHDDHKKITSMLARSFKAPLKKYPRTIAQGIVDSIAVDERIVEISIRDLDESRIFIHAIFPERVKKEVYTQTMPIIIKGKRSGEVITKISTSLMHSQLDELFKANLIHFLIQFGLSLALVLWIFYIKLTRPIARLLSFIHTLSDYHITPQSAWYYKDEIGLIGRAFEQAKRTIAHTAMSDPQTGIHNHYMLTKILQNLFCQPDQKVFSTILINIANFNQINDHHGHIKGDALLLSLIQDIVFFKKPQHHLGRWSGSSLMIICPQENCAQVESFALQLSNHIERTLYEDKISVQCAIGISQLQTYDLSINSIVRRVNSALSSAKKRPFGTVCVQLDDEYS